MIRLLGMLLCASCLLLNGCLGSLDYGRLIDASGNAIQAASVNEDELKNMSKQMRAQMDSASQVAPENSQYTKRLKRIMAKETSVNGVPLNYKVYITSDKNANATPDGSVRVYSGLMDALNDDELRFVLGHEIGHVANGHSLKAMRMAYATAAAKSAAGALHPTAATITDSGLGDLARGFLNAQYSQSQELDADSYGMNFLKANHYDTSAAVSAMRKLGGSGSGFFSTHPSGERRIKNLEALERGEDPKTLKTDS